MEDTGKKGKINLNTKISPGFLDYAWDKVSMRKQT
jgi:hypothetical protein